jgi:superfamily II DNA/RNA helicase
VSSQSFADLGVSNVVVRALAQRGYEEPFAVQRLVISDVLAGRDVLAQSPTGSGKTLAFGVPIVDRIEASARRPAALILAPTRELASQIVDELRDVAAARSLSVAAVYGGVGIDKQAKAAARAHILVATPGRLEDLLDRRSVTLEHVQVLVLDEADRMLDMGFKPPVDRIVAQTPRGRQTLFFSATLEGATGKLAREYTRDPQRHVHAPTAEKRADVDHRFVHVSRDGRIGALVSELGRGERTLVFVRTKRGADRLVKRLRSENVTAVAMHGDKTQSQREKALARFASGDVHTLVATDVAARGIDVDDITRVVNFDAPEDRDTYTHRVGRTGRAGRSGSGVSFVLADQAHDVRRIAMDLGLGTEFDQAHGGPPVRSGGPSRNGGSRNGGPRKGNGGSRNGSSRNARSTSRSNGSGSSRTIATAGSRRRGR